MKYVFGFILLIHGVIHLIGFAKAFYLTDIRQQVLGISKPIGSFWLFTFILFIVSLTMFITNKKWFYAAFLAVVLSQTLIINAWQEAKFGTIANIIIFLASLSTYGNDTFQNMVNDESASLLKIDNRLESKIITKNDLKSLPKIVKKWLINSGTEGREKARTVYLEQQGQMRRTSNSKWMPFNATQYFNIDDASFVWSTNVNAMPMINMVGRDKLVDGKGEMLIKLAGLIPVINEKENPKINTGAMIRFLSEICWFPSAAISDYMSWQEIDDTSAKATLTYNDVSVSGVFSFTKQGDLISFEANRYYGGSNDAKEEKWLIEIKDYKRFNRIKIPSKSTVTWKFETGDFHWLTVEIVDLKLNIK